MPKPGLPIFNQAKAPRLLEPEEGNRIVIRNWRNSLLVLMRLGRSLYTLIPESGLTESGLPEPKRVGPRLFLLQPGTQVVF